LAVSLIRNVEEFFVDEILEELFAESVKPLRVMFDVARGGTV
jgi:hypothetical protein